MSLFDAAAAGLSSGKISKLESGVLRKGKCNSLLLFLVNPTFRQCVHVRKGKRFASYLPTHPLPLT
jgi:hypothetical protein